MLRYVIAFFGIEVLVAIALAGASHFVDDIPNSASTLTTVIAATGAIWWFIRRENRRLLASEIWAFAIGAMIADLILSALWLVAMILILDAPFSWEGVIAAFGGELESGNTGTVVIAGMVIGGIKVLLMSAFFAWLLTKQLPEGVESENV